MTCELSVENVSLFFWKGGGSGCGDRRKGVRRLLLHMRPPVPSPVADSIYDSTDVAKKENLL